MSWRREADRSFAYHQLLVFVAGAVCLFGTLTAITQAARVIAAA
jgi:hypothetical protein